MAAINRSSSVTANQNNISNIMASRVAMPDINKITDAIITKLAQSAIKVKLEQPMVSGNQILDTNVSGDRDILVKLFLQIFNLAVLRNQKHFTAAEQNILPFMAILDSHRQGIAPIKLNILLTVIEDHFSYATLDEDIIEVYANNMVFHDDKRKVLKSELEKTSAELKTYSVIQSEINRALSAADTKSQVIETNFNLMNYRLYGYSSEAEFNSKAEYQLLQKIAPSSLTVTIKQFLLSAAKQNGAMSRVEDSYKYDKDNNRLGNFSTMVSDRSRPLSDSISEKTTRLNDISGRYNAVIEAPNRFIQKYDSVIQDILRAI